MGAPAVFLDKDGTLIEDVPYNVDPERITLMPGVREGLPRLAAAGYRFVVITNQSGVARGLFTVDDLARMHDHLAAELAPHGVRLDGIYFCPHHPDGVVAGLAIRCDCRKPQPGMLLRAARDLGLALADSWFVGDILDDVEAGRRAGCRTVLLDNGHETEWVLTADRLPHHLATDLNEAAEKILAGRDGPSEETMRELLGGRKRP